MFTKSDTLMQQQLAQAGKLTVPSRMRTSFQQKAVMDEVRNNLHDDHQNDQIMIEMPTASRPA